MPVITRSSTYKTIPSRLPSIPEQPLSPKLAPITSDQQPPEFSISTPTSTSSEGECSSNSKCKSTIKRMVIFDWDDTLFPTTTTVNQRIDLSLTELYNYGAKVYKLLTTYIQAFGGDNIYIITNGGSGWIQYSLNQTSVKFQDLLLNRSKSDKTSPSNTATSTSNPLKDYFKSILALLTIYRIRTISARHLYGQQYPGDTTKWKQLTFEWYAYNHFINSSEHVKDRNIIISIGDSCDEWIASQYCLDYLKQRAYDYMIPAEFDLQRIKLRSQPSLEYLMKEWDVLIKMAGDTNGKLISTYNSFDDNSNEFGMIKNRNLRIRAQVSVNLLVR